MQLVDEEWCYSMNRQAAERDEKEKRSKCSVVAALRSESAPTIVAQNVDLPDYVRGHMVVLRLRPKELDLEAFVITMAGCIGMNGMNSAGVGICMNALLQLANGASGLPVAALVRGALERRSAKDAERFATGVLHASGQAYTIGDRERIFCVEASHGKVVPCHEGRSRFSHTNHPLANDNLSRLGRWLAAHPGAAEGPKNSAARYESCSRRIADESAPLTLEAIRKALSSHDSEKHPVCRHFAPDAGFSAASTIFELSEKPALHLAGNPPCRSEPTIHAFD
jgi:hypothetical protein